MININNFPEKFKKLPPHIQEIMLSPATADINRGIAKKYKLTGEKTRQMVNIIVSIIVKDNPLETLVKLLQQNLDLDIEAAKKMALDITEKRFLPLKDYLQGTKALIQNLSGKTSESKPKTSTPPTPQIPTNVVDLKKEKEE